MALALLLGAGAMSWLSWSAPVARAGHALPGRASRAVSNAAAAALATTITVNSTADGTLAVLAGNTTCDLREAVEAANTNAVVGQCPAGMAGANTINFSVTGTITLMAGELVISEALTIQGPGANLLTVSGNSAWRVFNIAAGSFDVTLSGLTIANGRVSSVPARGGGIFNNSTGTLTVLNSTLSGNRVSASGYGGGIYNTAGTVNVINSTLSNNSISASDRNFLLNFIGGGGIYNRGTLNVINSTLSGNFASASNAITANEAWGGGIYNFGTANVINSTLTGNSVSTSGGSGINQEAGGGIFTFAGTTNIKNSIIAQNSARGFPDVFGPRTSQGYNLIGNPWVVPFFEATGDQVGTVSAPLNPMLGPLANNGGPTPTHRLLAGSPAIDKGNSFGLMVDQRGSPRPVDLPSIANATGGDGADIGAYELPGPAVPSMPLVTIVDPFGCTGPGDVLTVTVTITNPALFVQPVTFASTLPAGLVGLPGTGTSTLGAAPVVTATGASFGLTVLAPGQSVTVTYQVQVGDAVGGTSLCITTASTFSDAAGPPVQACALVNCPAVGPGLPFAAAAEVSDQKAGSVLVYNLYASSAGALNTQNTRISITNTNPTLDIAVHLFFVDGQTCSIADALVCLTKNQTASFLASDLDPGTTGYVVAVAADLATGCPVNFNFLIGDAYVKLASGHAANLGAEAFAALAGGPVACDGNAVTAQLNFDGVSYNRAPRTLAASSIPARTDGNDTLLIVNRFGGNLAVSAATLTNLFGIFYDDAETALSFAFSPGVCQFRSSLSNNFPRTTPRLGQFIPAGRSGWLRLYSTSDIGLLGAVLNFNPNAGTTAGAFNQGRNLHKLTLTSTQTLVIPIFPPNCLD